MATAALVWREGNEVRVADVPTDREITIGRSDTADVRVADPTVSRNHAAIRFDGGRYVVENRSSTNPAQLAGRPLSGPEQLADAASLQLGSVRVVFHNLSAGDRISGPVCSHCRRENDSSGKDCWYCGTSLVSAATTARRRLQVLTRVISATDEHWDLHPGRALLLRPDATAAVVDADDPPPPDAALVAPDGPRLIARSTGSAATVNGQPLSDAVELKSGDSVQAGAARFWVLVR
jgi:FHA domain